MSALRNWLWLSLLPGIGCLKKNLLLCSFSGAEEIHACRDTEVFLAAGMTEKDCASLLDKSMTRADAVLAECRRLGVRIVTQRDAAYPEKLRTLTDAPIVLYVLGELPPLDDHLSIACIGTRHPSLYGQTMAAAFTDRLARAGAIIVTGMAMGNDSDAARAALRADRPTVAVLGCGVDVCYPRSSRDIYGWIPQKGAIISEYPPGTEPKAHHFPERNRIMSGLSDGVLIFEASQKSGTLITARCALDQGREVFCVPGNLGAVSAGTNGLIAAGEAKAVLTPWDILTEYTAKYADIDRAEETRPFRPGMPPAQPEAKPAQPDAEPPVQDRPPAVSLSEDERRIYDCLGEEKKHIDDILRETGMPAAKVLTHLTLMEMKGRVKALPGKYYTVKYGS
ncbi:MAG: DNA-processing protein DprA [Clostridia bacterium]|nr:DNA-processing protein DprA [Clostridia bacterium]